jgi:pimeloyl-ACP methyl ester carboxylesterase
MAVIQREGSRQVYYEDYGEGSNAIVLIHAWGLSCRAWDSNTQALVRAGFRVIALDARGCGQSDKDFDTMTLTAVADDVAAIIDTLELTAVVLNGWSFGGAVAVIAAEKIASRCKGLVLTAAATPIYTQKPGLALGSSQEDFEQIIAALAVDRPAVLQNLAQGCVSEHSDAELVPWLRGLFMESSPSASALLAELGEVDQRAALEQLDCPILSCVGKQDTLVDPDICRSVDQFNGNTTTIEFELSGHSPPLEEATKYNLHVVEFLEATLLD